MNNENKKKNNRIIAKPDCERPTNTTDKKEYTLLLKNWLLIIKKKQPVTPRYDGSEASETTPLNSCILKLDTIELRKLLSKQN
tara:strand:+ start:281 stop:529 length:249 start_codon:yes stop_codon:yes gene_type:complete